MKEHTYHDQVNIDNAVKLRGVIACLPRFCSDFFRGIEPSTSSRTRIAYAYDLRIFFEFLHENNSYCNAMAIKDFPLSIMDQIKAVDIEEFLDYLKYYVKEGVEYTNDERGKMRKLAALRTFYNYFYKKELIEKNPAQLVTMPKVHEKSIIRLDVDEVASLLDEVEQGTKLTKKQQQFHAKTKVRDLAILTLMLGTGIRVSECVGLDIDDVDFKNGGIKIKRKGGNEVVIYFGEEVEIALLNYLEERELIIPETGSQNALFLSLQNKRIGVRSVENLVKKYSKLVTQLKKITPHKLRSTYGTSLYRETGDIYLVADVLGHKDVNTTKKHYAAIEDERRRSAAKAVRLRESIDVQNPAGGNLKND
jgi:site-specific recombinase XerD